MAELSGLQLIENELKKIVTKYESLKSPNNNAEQIKEAFSKAATGGMTVLKSGVTTMMEILTGKPSAVEKAPVSAPEHPASIESVAELIARITSHIEDKAKEHIQRSAKKTSLNDINNHIEELYEFILDVNRMQSYVTSMNDISELDAADRMLIDNSSIKIEATYEPLLNDLKNLLAEFAQTLAAEKTLVIGSPFLAEHCKPMLDLLKNYTAMALSTENSYELLDDISAFQDGYQGAINDGIKSPEFKDNLPAQFRHYIALQSYLDNKLKPEINESNVVDLLVRVELFNNTNWSKDDVPKFADLYQKQKKIKELSEELILAIKEIDVDSMSKIKAEYMQKLADAENMAPWFSFEDLKITELSVPLVRYISSALQHDDPDISKTKEIFSIARSLLSEDYQRKCETEIEMAERNKIIKDLDKELAEPEPDIGCIYNMIKSELLSESYKTYYSASLEFVKALEKIKNPLEAFTERSAGDITLLEIKSTLDSLNLDSVLNQLSNDQYIPESRKQALIGKINDAFPVDIVNLIKETANQIDDKGILASTYPFKEMSFEQFESLRESLFEHDQFRKRMKFFKEGNFKEISFSPYELQGLNDWIDRNPELDIKKFKYNEESDMVALLDTMSYHVLKNKTKQMLNEVKEAQKNREMNPILQILLSDLQKKLERQNASLKGTKKAIGHKAAHKIIKAIEGIGVNRNSNKNKKQPS